MSVSFQGVGQVCATFLGEGLSAGQAVKMSGRGTVGPCGDGDKFCGVTAHYGEGACSVLVSGFVTVKYSGTVPGVGWAELCADGGGGVRSQGEQDGGGVRCLVVDADTAEKTVTVLL